MKFSQTLGRLLVMCSFAAILLGGCTDSGNDFVFTNLQQQGFTLRVAADPAALARGAFLGQIGANAVQFQITVFDLNANQVAQQTVARGATAVFNNLNEGLYVVRLVGLDGASNVVGYFDRLIFLNSNETVLVPGLRITNTPPAPDPTGGGNPYFLFTAVPTTNDAGTAFSVTARVFTAQGLPATAVTNGVSLVSNTLALAANPANQNTDANGIVTFANLQFPATTGGTTTFTVDATGVDAATSNQMTVTATAFFERASLTSTNGQTMGGAAFPDVSSDGSVVSFQSEGSDLVPNDTNMRSDVFVRDRTSGVTERVSVSSMGAEGNNTSSRPVISGNGRFVAFVSGATNLVTGDTNGVNDVFVYDRTNDTIERVSVDSAGNEGNGTSGPPAISDDGRYVAFPSSATNLAAGGFGGVYLRDRQTDTTIRVSVDGGGNPVNGQASTVAISGNGQVVAFDFTTPILGSDTNGDDDIYVRDLSNNTTEIVSVDNAGNEGNGASNEPSLSQDGRYVSFESEATDLVANDTNGSNDVFVYDRTNDTVELASRDSAGTIGNDPSGEGRLSDDARFVTFSSTATNLVAGDTNGRDDIFVRDRMTNQVSRVSVNLQGTESDQHNQDANISGDGKVIVFQTDSDLLITGDTNGVSDIVARNNPLP